MASYEEIGRQDVEPKMAELGRMEMAEEIKAGTLNQIDDIKESLKSQLHMAEKDEIRCREEAGIHASRARAIREFLGMDVDESTPAPSPKSIRSMHSGIV